jgi:hypothetical protein
MLEAVWSLKVEVADLSDSLLEPIVNVLPLPDRP